MADQPPFDALLLNDIDGDDSLNIDFEEMDWMDLDLGSLEWTDDDSADRQLLDAAKAGDWASIEQSLQDGATINAKFANDSNCTALHWAIWFRRWTVAFRLLEVPGMDLEAMDSTDGDTPFFYACCVGHLPMVQKLKSLGVNLQHRNIHGQTALHYTCDNSQMVVADYLMSDCGFGDPNIVDHENDTALHKACMSGYQGLVALVLDRGGNSHAKNTRGDTPLHIAACHGDWQMIRLLLARGARLDERNNRDRTALHAAIAWWNGNHSTAIIQVLIEQGASILGQDDVGWTPFDIALNNGTVEMCNLLLEAYRNKVSASHGLLAYHVILRTAVYVDITRERFFHAPMHPLGLHIALGTLSVEWLRTLMRSFDSDLLVRHPDNGSLPIHVACSGGAPAEILRILVEFDPGTLNVLERDSGMLPIHILCSRGRANLESLRVLVEHGGVGTLQARDLDGSLPLHRLLGAQTGRPERDAVNYLLKNYPGSASIATRDGDLSFVVACRASCSADVLFVLLKEYPEALSLSTKRRR